MILRSENLQLQSGMSATSPLSSRTGLIQCFQNFEGVYCYRKLVELVLSCAFMVTAIAILVIFLKKYRLARPYWLAAVLSLLIASLIPNILFCFFNNQYWIYAAEDYFYSMYYLILVSYICYHYILRHSGQQKEDLMQKLNITLELEEAGEPKSPHKIIFSIVVCLLGAFYLSILIASLVYEIEQESQQNSGNPNSNIDYCQQTWYLILNVVCFLLSILVVIVMFKTQHQEFNKIIKFKEDSYGTERKYSNMTEESQSRSGSDNSDHHSIDYKSASKKIQVKNPFVELWWWIGINVASHLINLIQSGFLLDAVAPQCLIMAQNPSGSNALALVMVLFTFYMGYGATLWYILFIKILQARTGIDRSVLYSDEYKVEGNIELFVPSKVETITFQQTRI